MRKLVYALSLYLAACGSDPVMAPAAADGAAAVCELEPGCRDLDTAYFKYPACCTAKYACGYELSFEDDFLMVYPQARDILVQLTLDDPNGKCAPESALFPIRPGTYDHRVELPGAPEDDILVAAQCESRGFSVFSLPGCCMRDDRCGISTDEMAPSFQVLLDGQTAPFAEPECLSADALNMQLAASKLAAFARIPPTSGARCDHAALAEAQPRYRQPGR